jgi:hypothetical protein
MLTAMAVECGGLIWSGLFYSEALRSTGSNVEGVVVAVMLLSLAAEGVDGNNTTRVFFGWFLGRCRACLGCNLRALRSTTDE